MLEKEQGWLEGGNWDDMYLHLYMHLHLHLQLCLRLRLRLHLHLILIMMSRLMTIARKQINK